LGVNIRRNVSRIKRLEALHSPEIISDSGGQYAPDFPGISHHGTSIIQKKKTLFVSQSNPTVSNRIIFDPSLLGLINVRSWHEYWKMCIFTEIIHIMRTNIEIDDALMEAAMKASGNKTKKETVEAGLRLLVALQQQASIKSFRGKLRWEGDLEAMRRDL
jgi:Arc/MetJ family transcription regulator